MRSLTPVAAALVVLAISGVLLAQTDRLELQGEFIVLQGAEEPRDYGCELGRTCEGWAASW